MSLPTIHFVLKIQKPLVSDLVVGFLVFSFGAKYMHLKIHNREFYLKHAALCSEGSPPL